MRETEREGERWEIEERVREKERKREGDKEREMKG